MTAPSPDRDYFGPIDLILVDVHLLANAQPPAEAATLADTVEAIANDWTPPFGIPRPLRVVRR